MFSEGRVEVGGVAWRYAEAGQGTPLVDVHGAGSDARPTAAHELLARHVRVIVLELPAGGRQADAAASLGRALEALALGEVNLMGSGDCSAWVLELAQRQPERVRALVLEAPTAIARDAALAERLSEVATPTLVLFGTADAASAQESGRVYAERMPNGHLVFVYDAARTIGHDRPEAFADVVVDFVERHEAFIINRTPTVIHP